jgi:N-carbamoyl-L-amino-acid hydrolase
VSSFEAMWAELAPIGRGDDGGYRRLPWSVADSQMRAWFRDQATSRGLLIDEDRNGNQWAWWGRPAPGAVVTGSHLDSVPGGGAYDGPLGVVSGFLALDRLRAGAGGAGPQGIGKEKRTTKKKK